MMNTNSAGHTREIRLLKKPGKGVCFMNKISAMRRPLKTKKHLYTKSASVEAVNIQKVANEYSQNRKPTPAIKVGVACHMISAAHFSTIQQNLTGFVHKS